MERRSEASTLWLWLGGGEGVEEELFGSRLEDGICPLIVGDLVLVCKSLDMSTIECE